MTVTYSKVLKGYMVEIKRQFGTGRSLVACDKSRVVAITKALSRTLKTK